MNISLLARFTAKRLAFTASFAPLPFVRIQGGYRHIDLKIDEDDALASFKLSGPYVGAQVSF